MLKRNVMAPLALALGFAAVPAMSAVVEYTVVTSPPPAMQMETVPAPQAGMTWVPGAYDYRDGSYRWVAGHFEAERAGYVYVAPTCKVKDRIKNGDRTTSRSRELAGPRRHDYRRAAPVAHCALRNAVSEHCGHGGSTVVRVVIMVQLQPAHESVPALVMSPVRKVSVGLSR